MGPCGRGPFLAGRHEGLLAPQECSLGNPLGSESPKKCFNNKDSGNGSAEAVAVLVERGFCQIVAW